MAIFATHLIVLVLQLRHLDMATEDHGNHHQQFLHVALAQQVLALSHSHLAANFFCVITVPAFLLLPFPLLSTSAVQSPTDTANSIHSLRCPLQKYLCGNHPQSRLHALPPPPPPPSCQSSSSTTAVRAVRVESHDRQVRVRRRRRLSSNAGGANRLVRRGRGAWLAWRAVQGATRRRRCGAEEKSENEATLMTMTLISLTSHSLLSSPLF